MLILDQTEYVLSAITWMEKDFRALKNGNAIKLLVDDLNTKSQTLLGSIKAFRESGKKEVDTHQISEHFEEVKAVANKIKKEIRGAHPIKYFLYGLIKLFSKNPVIEAIEDYKKLEGAIKQNSECIKNMKNSRRD